MSSSLFVKFCNASGLLRQKTVASSGKIKLYMYNNWHNGDIIFSRPLYEKILARDKFDLAIGVYRNHAYLLEDLEKFNARLIISPISDSGYGCSGDLSNLCPRGYMSIHTWLGQYDDTHPHTWESTVTVFNRKSAEKGIDFFISYDFSNVPMVDFHIDSCKILPRAIYIENGFTRSGHSNFIFDLNKLGTNFPDFNFYCTAFPDSTLPNVHDCSAKNLVELSNISNQCVAILGKGSGPLLCTYTEVNRFKPRAVCGYDLMHCAPFWDYYNNPLQYLQTGEEILQFLERVSSEG